MSDEAIEDAEFVMLLKKLTRYELYHKYLSVGRSIDYWGENEDKEDKHTIERLKRRMKILECEMMFRANNRKDVEE